MKSTRRSALRNTLAAALSPWQAARADPDAFIQQVDAADRVYAYTIGLYQFHATRQAQLALGMAPNVFRHARELADARARRVTKPNHDTLYSAAWIRLDAGPLLLAIPASQSRYFSLQLIDAYTDNFAVRGTRADGGKARMLWLAGPRWRGAAPAATELVRAPTDAVWALARTYSAGGADSPAAWAMQDQLTIARSVRTPVVDWSATERQALPAHDDFVAYFDAVGRLLVAHPPPVADPPLLADLRRIGIEADRPADRFPVDPGALHLGGRRALLRLTQPRLPDDPHRSPYDARGRIALTGLAALPSSEAVYRTAVGLAADGTHPLLSGEQDYRIVFAAGALPPVDAFWSVTLYDGIDPDRAFFYPNERGVYSLGLPASPLVFDAEGTLVIHVGHRQPPGVPDANWLPAPAGGFTLVYRGYLPRRPLLDGGYNWPPVRRIA